MNHPSPEELKRTPLNGRHRALGARMVAFAGWEMPVEYAGVSREHMAVRREAGLFDVSHMGEIELTGPAALQAVQALASNDASRLTIGQAQYSVLTTIEGTFVDDIVVYRRGEDRFLLVVNAANREKDYRWIVEHLGARQGVAAVDLSARFALLALQGPASGDVLQPLTGTDLRTIRRYWFADGDVAGAPATIARTGYTGENGYELLVAAESAGLVWDAILASSGPCQVLPAGLAARDTLRLEAAMRLYGNDMDETTTVLEADLEWVIGWGKGDFMGRSALERQKAAGPARKLAGFELAERGIARHGYRTYTRAGEGAVTSGTLTPFLNKAIGLAYLPTEATAPGTEFDIDIRGRRTRARVVPLPFYKRPRS